MLENPYFTMKDTFGDKILVEDGGDSLVIEFQEGAGFGYAGARTQMDLTPRKVRKLRRALKRWLEEQP